jgi:uncharacterized protein
MGFMAFPPAGEGTRKGGAEVHHGPLIRPFDRAADKAYVSAVNETAGKPCPICGKPAAARFQPFCSARCKDVDLHRWFSGAYAIPGAELEDVPDDTDLRPRRRDETTH